MLEFKLKVKCSRNVNAPSDSEDPNELYISHRGTLCVHNASIYLFIYCILLSDVWGYEMDSYRRTVTTGEIMF